MAPYSVLASAWGSASNASYGNAQAQAPDGTNTAWKLTEDSADAVHYGSMSGTVVSYVAGTTYTVSRFLKSAGRTDATVYLPGSNFQPNGRTAVFNLSSGVVVSAESGVSASIKNAGNGWYRCVVTATATITGNGHAGGSALQSGNAYQGDGVSGVYVWGAQLEAGAKESSYIPTSGAAATRAADVAPMTGTNFSSWYRADEGTLFVEASSFGPASALTYAISDGTFNKSIYGTFIGENTYRGANVVDGGVGQANSISSFSGINSVVGVKDALAYKLNDFAESLGGLTARTDSLGTVPTVDRMFIGSNWNGGGNYLNGYIRRIAYFPRRLSNAELQVLTS